MKTIIDTIMERDGLTLKEAQKVFEEGYDEFHRRMIEDEDVSNFCMEWFGLEMDYIMELV